MTASLRSQLALALATLCVAAIWCILLPWLSTRPMVQKHLQFLDDKGIDPSAMYYTELEAMDAILDRIESRTGEYSTK